MRIDKETRKRAIEVISKFLAKREEVVLALIFGGFLDERPVRDIDVAVYTDYKVSYEEWPAYVDELSSSLERKLKEELGLLKAVDVVLLEYLPPRVRAKALSEGLVILNRSPGLRGLLLLRTLEEINALRRKVQKVKREPRPSSAPVLEDLPVLNA